MRFCLAALALLAAPAGAQIFSDASAALPPSGSGGNYGASIVDANGDGRVDLVGPQRVLLRTDDGFRAVPIEADTPLGTVFADVDGDGLPDAYVLAAFDPGIYDFHPARERFERSPESFSVDAASFVLTQGSVLLDIDPDGLLDAFVSNDGGSDVLFRGIGGGAFEDATPRLPVFFATDYGAHAADYDRDGDADIAIGVCPGGSPNLLYRNDGDTFAEVAAAAGVADVRAGWGVVWADIDNDGWLDLYVANMPDGGGEPGTNALYRNNRDGTFTDIAAAAGVAGDTGDTGWTVLAADLDNDGWTDLVAVNSPEPSRLYRNDGDGTFTDVTAASGLGDLTGIAASVGDLDGDGWPDLYATRHADTGRDVLRLNDGGTNGWLKVRLRGIAATPDGIGARVEVTAGELSMVREITAGDGMMGQSHALAAHVGLGEAAAATVTVRWPSGTVDVVDNVAPNQTLHLVEGVGLDEPPAAFALTAPEDGAAVDPDAAVTLAWEPAADDGAVTYTLTLARTDGSGDDVVIETTETSAVVDGGALDLGAYRWTVVARDAYSARASLGPRGFVAQPVAAEAGPDAVVAVRVSPNPSAGAAAVHFALARAGAVHVEVLDVLGRRVGARELGVLAAGPHTATLPLGALGPGAYLVRVVGAEGAATARWTRTR